MATYNISAEIKTNTAPTNLYYEMELYKTDWNGNKTYALRPTGQQPLQAGNKTQLHPSLDIPDPQETCYILAITIYRKVGANFIKVTQDPMTAITPLKGFLTNGKDWGASREFEYYETTQQTQKSQQGQINTFQLNISSKPRIFEAKEHPIGDPLDPFAKQNVEDELRIRMTRPYKSYVFDINKTPSENGRISANYRQVGAYPNQSASMFCGAASFFYCIQKDRPDLYQQMIKELWESGRTKIRTLEIKPGKGVRHPHSFFNEMNRPFISSIDWMTLASIVDSHNTFIFPIRSPSAGLFWWNYAGAITMWGELERWFVNAGTSKKFNNVGISHSNLQDVCRLNSYINPDHHIVTLIGAGMLSEEKTRFKDHWIVWEDKVRLLNGSEVTTNTRLEEKIQLTMFSWGNVDNQLRKNLTLGEFLKYLYGGMVFTKIP